MTQELLHAFTQLRISERQAVLADLNYSMQPAQKETCLDFCTRVCRQVSSDGRVRDLEFAMMRFQ